MAADVPFKKLKVQHMAADSESQGSGGGAFVPGSDVAEQGSVISDRGQARGAACVSTDHQTIRCIMPSVHLIM